jgi:hypothetical protein
MVRIEDESESGSEMKPNLKSLTTAFHEIEISSKRKSSNSDVVAPGVGLEPARPRRATGSQAHARLKACALIHSAHGVARHGSSHYPGTFSRHQKISSSTPS